MRQLHVAVTQHKTLPIRSAFCDAGETGLPGSYLKKVGVGDDTRSEVVLTAHGVGNFNVGAPVSASLGSPFLCARKEAYRARWIEHRPRIIPPVPP